MHTVLFWIFLTINAGGIGAYFVYFYWHLKKDDKLTFKFRQINIKNRTFYFYNDQINLKEFDIRMLKIDERIYKKIDIYYIGYVTVKKIANCNNVNSANPLYLMIKHF